MAVRKIILLFCLTMSMLRAAEFAGGRALAVQSIAPSARALALGNAYAAHRPDAASFLWNPGGLAFVGKKEIATLQTQLAADVDFFGLSAVLPLAQCALGFYWAQLQIADIPETAASLNNNEVVLIDSLSYYENTAVLAAAKEILPGLGLGVSLRHSSQQISAGYGYGSGWSGAAGLYCRLSALTLGLTADNLSAYQEYDTGSIDRLPQNYTAGLGWQIMDKLGLYYDRRFSEGSVPAQNYWGLEILLTPRIQLAAGCLEDRFTAGAGLAMDYVYFAYAYAAQNKHSLGSDQYISLGARW
ncbi:MAG: hypothetical protein LBD99_00555 [Candidatus Margulisbacteria bacterium]|jgi:hypothetical protein|nr:hypothetical protein [Candidatus Margulisiibacteriota bacterium]